MKRFLFSTLKGVHFMKSNPGRLLKIGLVVCTLMGVTLGCKISFDTNDIVSSQPEVKTDATVEVQQPTEAPAVEEEATQQATLETVATATAESTALLNPTATVTPVTLKESWRIAPMPGATLVAYDQTSNLDASAVAVMDQQAAYLAIPKPYYFELYYLPMNTTAADVLAHYNTLITAAGFKKAMDDEGLRGVTLTTWLHTSVKGRKYAVQFNPAGSGEGQQYPAMFIIYSKP
jgi:hypothetical protein